MSIDDDWYDWYRCTHFGVYHRTPDGNFLCLHAACDGKHLPLDPAPMQGVKIKNVISLFIGKHFNFPQNCHTLYWQTRREESVSTLGHHTLPGTISISSILHISILSLLHKESICHRVINGSSMMTHHTPARNNLHILHIHIFSLFKAYPKDSVFHLAIILCQEQSTYSPYPYIFSYLHSLSRYIHIFPLSLSQR